MVPKRSLQGVQREHAVGPEAVSPEPIFASTKRKKDSKFRRCSFRDSEIKVRGVSLLIGVFPFLVTFWRKFRTKVTRKNENPSSNNAYPRYR
jgi:hypothetical protein